VNNPILNAVGTVSYNAQRHADGCRDSSLAVSPAALTITAAPDAPISGGNQTQCEASPTQTLTATATVPNGQTVVWYNQATGGSKIGSASCRATGTVTEYAEATGDGGGRTSQPRTLVT